MNIQIIDQLLSILGNQEESTRKGAIVLFVYTIIFDRKRLLCR